MNKTRLFAVPGRVVRDPRTRAVVGPEGITVDLSPGERLRPYWMRLLAAADLTQQPPIPAPAPPAAAQEETHDDQL